MRFAPSSLEGSMRAGQYKCRHCGRINVEKRKGQKYCGRKECQRSRKREWNRRKYASDPDYRANQRESTAAWLSSQGGAAQYYRAYRHRRREKEDAPGAASEHQAKGERGKTLDKTSPSAVISKRLDIPSSSAESTTVLDESANMDARSSENAIKSGRYSLCPAGANGDTSRGANRDPIVVELRVITI